MKKIAFILQALTGGGAERTVANLSFALSDYCDVYIILFDGTKVGYPYKGTIIDLGIPSKKSKISKIVNVFKRTQKLKKIKKDHNFDVVVSFMFGANFVNVLSRRNEKVVTSARNFMSAYGLTASRKFQERYTGRKADRIVAISEMVRQDLINNFGLPSDKIETIYNPCDVQRIKTYYAEEPSFEFNEDCFYFVTAGRLVRQKGQWDLLKAFSIIAKKYPSARLIILGTGELEEKLKNLAKLLGIDSTVFFLGFQDNPYAYMKRCNAFALTSLHEGLGNVVLEAMACDLPVISTDCYAGPREVLAPELDLFEKAKDITYCNYGILVPEISYEEDYTQMKNPQHELLARAMEQIMTDKEMSMRYVANNPDRLRNFDPIRIAEQWYRLFFTVVDQDE